MFLFSPVVEKENCPLVSLGVKELGSPSIGVPYVTEEESVRALRSPLWHELSLCKGREACRFLPGSFLTSSGRTNAVFTEEWPLCLRGAEVWKSIACQTFGEWHPVPNFR